LVLSCLQSEDAIPSFDCVINKVWGLRIPKQ
jgi:hypothetical protein